MDYGAPMTRGEYIKEQVKLRDWEFSRLAREIATSENTLRAWVNGVNPCSDSQFERIEDVFAAHLPVFKRTGKSK